MLANELRSMSPEVIRLVCLLTFSNIQGEHNIEKGDQVVRGAQRSERRPNASASRRTSIFVFR